MDPQDPYVKLKAAAALARKKLGMRHRMAVVPLDPAPRPGRAELTHLGPKPPDQEQLQRVKHRSLTTRQCLPPRTPKRGHP